VDKNKKKALTQYFVFSNEAHCRRAFC